MIRIKVDIVPAVYEKERGAKEQQLAVIYAIATPLDGTPTRENLLSRSDMPQDYGVHATHWDFVLDDSGGLLRARYMTHCVVRHARAEGALALVKKALDTLPNAVLRDDLSIPAIYEGGNTTLPEEAPCPEVDSSTPRS